MDQNLITSIRRSAAQAALKYLPEGTVIGLGTGKTTNLFIEQLAAIKHKIQGAVPSSLATAEQLKAAKISRLELNGLDELPVYFDSADAFNVLRQLVKGGAGALTREKVLASAAKKFICMVDDRKQAEVLGKFPIPVEVIPMARSYVARELVKLGGQPQYRDNFTTDNGNSILDVYGWEIEDPITLETKINQISGVVCNGIFALRPADILIIGTEHGVVEK